MARVRRFGVFALSDAAVADLSSMPRFERFLREERGPLVCFLRRRTRSFEDAEDAAQESLSRLVRYYDEHPEASWKPLLYRIASNVVIDQTRRASVRCVDAQIPFDEALHEFASAEVPHELRVEFQQELATARDVILSLPVRCRQVYLLNRIDGMSYAEVATHLGVSVKTVERHISKALTALRRKLGTRSPGAL